MTIADLPGGSNREVAERAGIVDQGQISKLLTRLEYQGLIVNRDTESTARGTPNSWWLTEHGETFERELREHPVGEGDAHEQASGRRGRGKRPSDGAGRSVGPVRARASNVGSASVALRHGSVSGDANRDRAGWAAGRRERQPVGARGQVRGVAQAAAVEAPDRVERERAGKRAPAGAAGRMELKRERDVHCRGLAQNAGERKLGDRRRAPTQCGLCVGGQRERGYPGCLLGGGLEGARGARRYAWGFPTARRAGGGAAAGRLTTRTVGCGRAAGLPVRFLR